MAAALDSGQQQLLEAIQAVESKLDGLADALLSRRSGADDVTPLSSSQKYPRPPWEEAGGAASLLASGGSFGSGVKTTRSLLEGRIESPQPFGRSGSASVVRRRSNFSAWDSLELAMRPGFETKRPLRNSAPVIRRSRMSSVDSIVDVPEESCQAWHPDSASRLAFEVTSMVMLLYDAFIVPYGLAWDVSTETLFFQVAIWITRIFWTSDLLLNGVTGFRDADAKLIRDIPSSMKRYAKSWLLPDLILVTCDWLTISNAFGGGTRYIAWMRVMRLVRGGRQVLRGWTLVLKAKLRVQEKGFHLVMDIALLLLMILWVNHVVCCAWYSIGVYSESDTGYTWLKNNDLPSGGTYYEYLTALHWAITQMTPGSMEVVPKSSGERLFNVCVLLLGLLMGSSLVATLTSMMTQYKLRVEGASKKLLLLHQYLVQQRADTQLALAIKMQVRARRSENVRLKPKDVEYLSLLSTHLQDALWHSWCMQQLAAHPLFVSLPLVDTAAVQALSKTALRTLEFPPGDAAFEEGAIGECMYFVVHGVFRYNPGDFAPEACIPKSDPALLLKPGAMCCEPSLWTVWTHLGNLEAVAVSEVLAFSATSLRTTLAKFPVAYNVISDYCASFHKYINEPGIQRSDLSAGLDVFEIISGLSTETRNRLAAPVLQSLEARFLQIFLSKTKLELLKQEVNNGESDVGLVGKEVVRHTFVVALRVGCSHDPERFLVQVGSVLRDSGRLEAHCTLPGIKRKWRESYSSAVQRLINSELQEVLDGMETHFGEGCCERSVFFRQSSTYRIRTRYLRTTFSSTIAADTPLRLLSAESATVPSPKSPGALAWCFSTERRKTSLAEREAADVLRDRKNLVVLKCSAEKRTSDKLYLFLLPHEYETLASPAAAPIVEEWLYSLREEWSRGAFLWQPASGESTRASESDDSDAISRFSF